MSTNDEIRKEIENLKGKINELEHKLSNSDAERIVFSDTWDESYKLELSPSGTVRNSISHGPFVEDSVNDFRSEKFATEVGEKIELIMELATLKEWLCPDYDEIRCQLGWAVRRKRETGKYDIVLVSGIGFYENNDIMFDKKSAETAAEIMNKRYYDGD